MNTINGVAAPTASELLHLLRTTYRANLRPEPDSPIDPVFASACAKARFEEFCLGPSLLGRTFEQWLQLAIMGGRPPS